MKELQELDDTTLPHGWERGLTVDGFVYYIEYVYYSLFIYLFLNISSYLTQPTTTTVILVFLKKPL
jgi:hypothetical protein